MPSYKTKQANKRKKAGLCPGFKGDDLAKEVRRMMNMRTGQPTVRSRAMMAYVQARGL